MEPAKGTNEPCESDFECRSFRCEQRVCAPEIPVRSGSFAPFLLVGLLVLVLLAIVLAVLLLRPMAGKKDARGETKKPAYRPPRFAYKEGGDELEQKLKASMGRLRK